MSKYAKKLLEPSPLPDCSSEELLMVNSLLGEFKDKLMGSGLKDTKEYGGNLMQANSLVTNNIDSLSPEAAEYFLQETRKLELELLSSE